MTAILNNSATLFLRGIQKEFPGVVALKGIDFDVRAGEVHALVGENGAGKSTLMHILAGVFRPDAGSIYLAGVATELPDEASAQRAGIALVFQERSLFLPLSVAENIFAGRQPVTRAGMVDWRRLREMSGALLRELDLELDPGVLVEDLSPAQQQMVEIAKALSLQARLVLFDEPTAALTSNETQVLFRIIRALQARGVGVVYISHRLEEIFAIADRVTVFKDGEGQGTFAVRNTAPDELIRRMVGRELTRRRPRSTAGRQGGALLEVRHYGDCPARAAKPLLHDIQFQAYAGEIVVMAGLNGAGRTEFALSLFGARQPVMGEVLVQGRPFKPRTPATAIAAGIGYLPEDRKEAALFLDQAIALNIAAGNLRAFGACCLDARRMRQTAEEFRTSLRIVSPDVDTPVENLSGGNQQKVILARWLLVRPRILIVDEPTRGIDVGAKSEVHTLLEQLAREGTAVIVISSDLPEVLAIADRIVVMRRGTFVAEVAAANASEEQVMRHASLN